MEKPRCERKGTVRHPAAFGAYVGLAIRSRYEVLLR